MDRNSTASSARPYGFAFALTVVGLLLYVWLLPLLGNITPFILLSMIVSAWYGGLGPGLLSTAVCSLGVIVLPGVFPGATHIGPTSDLQFILNYLIIGVLISVLSEALHRERRRVIEKSHQIVRSTEQFQLLVNNVKDYAIFMLDTGGHIASWNQGAQAIKGYTANEIIGQHFSKFYKPEEVASGKLEMELRVAREKGSFEEEGWRLRKDGSQFWANVVITAVYDEQGELRGYAKVTRDMTERKLATDRNEQLVKEKLKRQEAESANRTKDQFLALVSHELRTPLNAILGWACLLQRDDLDREQALIGLQTIERNARAQGRLVEDLLDVSRMLTGKFSIEFKPLDLAAVLTSVVNSVQPSAAARAIELRVEMEMKSIEIAGDEMRLQQVIWNLLSNAIKFTPTGGSIVVRLASVDSQIELRVQDNGRGIPPEILPYIFEHLRQADSSSTREHGGLGLGLAIVRYVVEAHGGTVRAQSEGEGKGATFTVRLPQVNADERDKPEVLPIKAEEATVSPVLAG